MNTSSIARLVLAALAVLLIVAACAGDTSAQWTFTPVTAPPVASAAAQSSAAPASQPVEPAASMAPMASTAPGEPTASGAPVVPAGEARVIDLVLTGALQITDPSGAQVRDIPVTPGETITFRVDNQAGFDHNFYIGTDEQLIVPAGTTDTGIATWQSGVQELTWVVPADITGLKFGCTVPGHYSLMQGTFSVAA
jgi:uncharacterized protein YcgI (DUF1989 family)